MTQQLLVEFCLRLAAGLACAMVAVLGQDVGRQFFRTIMLVILGLCVLARLNWPGGFDGIGMLLPVCAALSFFGFAFWTLGRIQLGGYSTVVIGVCTWASLVIHGNQGKTVGDALLVSLANGSSSALLLGSMVAAMLLGHTYLISPTMSIAPLQRLVVWVVGSVGVRSLVSAGAGAWQLRKSAGDPTAASADLFWWLMVVARGVIGLVGPSIIAWMVWQTTRIRSTQSATGILYAGVVLVFFGELLGGFLGI